MDIQTFLNINKNNKKISLKGKIELFYYFERIIKNSLFDLGINYNDLSSYKEQSRNTFMKQNHLNDYNIGLASNLIACYDDKVLIIK
ncbi:hypothetical protein [Brachyspira hyodysenteriae]|uniref:hypothetical protein n=1 Tax=Brachyspira hyodysenteriae TaxID=159 RepID=UPI00063D8D5A|nr:hypothetical protein [Brachyspira hyodysenteriae]KLI46134.1 hypothetical protein SZ41_12260 [Brachyspira hyodysenteriae]KLI53625.1 hypothetical protein SZ42_00605 [Brachyspira hyodysenteriae]